MEGWVMCFCHQISGQSMHKRFLSKAPLHALLFDIMWNRTIYGNAVNVNTTAVEFSKYPLCILIGCMAPIYVCSLGGARIADFLQKVRLTGGLLIRSWTTKCSYFCRLSIMKACDDKRSKCCSKNQIKHFISNCEIFSRQANLCTELEQFCCSPSANFLCIYETVVCNLSVMFFKKS